MQIRHQLRGGDVERRVQYSQWLLGKPQAFMSQIIIGDEAIFQLNRNVFNHNVVRFAPRGDPPEDFVNDKPSSGERLAVWIELVRSNLIGPYFFLTGTSMARPIWRCFNNNCVLPQVEKIFRLNQNGSIPRAYWFHDGSPGHRLYRTMIVYTLCSLIGLWVSCILLFFLDSMFLDRHIM